MSNQGVFHLIKRNISTRLPGGELYKMMYRLKRTESDDPVFKSFAAYMRHLYWHTDRSKSKPFLPDRGGYIELYDLKFPMIDQHDQLMFWREFCNCILPYYLEKTGHAYEWERIDYLWNQGPYELNENISVRPGDIVIDGGANIGEWSAVAARKGAKVYAFEISSWVRKKYLNKTAKLNGNIKVIPYAVGKCNGECEFKSMRRRADGGVITGNEKSFTEKVRVVSLDSFIRDKKINKVDFIKSNLWGGERDMLLGAKNVIREYKPRISAVDYYPGKGSQDLEELLLSIEPGYIVKKSWHKIYAYVP